MQKLNDKLKEVKVLVTAKTIKGTSFVGVRGYANKQGEVTNQTIVVGFSYANLLANDTKRLEQFDIAPIIEKYGEETAKKAYSELLESLYKRQASEEEKEELRKQNDSTMNRSDGQSDAFTTLAKGIKQKNDTKEIYIFGLGVSKKVLVKGEYKPTKSRAKTLAKRDIKKLAELRDAKIKRFRFKDASQINLQGVNV